MCVGRMGEGNRGRRGAGFQREGVGMHCGGWQWGGAKRGLRLEWFAWALLAFLAGKERGFLWMLLRFTIFA